MKNQKAYCICCRRPTHTNKTPGVCKVCGSPARKPTGRYCEKCWLDKGRVIGRSGICRICGEVAITKNARYCRTHAPKQRGGGGAGVCGLCGEKARTPTGRYCQKCWDATRPKKFKKHLLETKGQGFLDDLEDLRTRPFTTLESVAEKHGITRERVRQIYNKLYQKKYGKYTKANAAKRDAIKQDCKMLDSIKCTVKQKVADYEMGFLKAGNGFLGEYHFIKTCQTKGIDVEYIDCGRGIDFVANGKTVEVKISRKLTKSGKVRYYHCNIRPNQQKADIIAAYIQPKDVFYIIPNHNSVCSYYIPEVPSVHHMAKNRWERYKNAWYILFQ